MRPSCPSYSLILDATVSTMDCARGVYCRTGDKETWDENSGPGPLAKGDEGVEGVEGDDIVGANGEDGLMWTPKGSFEAAEESEW